MKIGKLFLTAVTFCSVASLQAQSGTQIVAHRGYWKTEGSAQNSIASLEKAIEIGCRGSEIDLILTTDGVLVLHHDDAIAGKRVDASTYAEIKDVKLSNGESLPTFDAFLAVARTQKGTKPIIEIKPHQTKQKEDAAVLAALDAVRRAGMNKRVEYISFSKNICEQLIAKESRWLIWAATCRPGSSPSGDIPDSIIISARCGLMRSGSTRRGSWASRSMSGLSMTRDR